MIFKIWSYIDLFQSPLTLYLGGSDRRSSKVGVFFSVVIYIYLLYSFVNSDLFEKSSPIVVNQSNQIPHARRVSFQNNSLMAFGVADGFNGRYQDDTIFNIQFRYFVNATQLVVKKMRACLPTDVTFNDSIYYALHLDNMYCLEDKDFFLEGNWDEGRPTYIALNIYQCNNITSNGKCKSQEVINSFFQDPLVQKFFTLIFQNPQINMNDYQNPFQISYRTDYQAIDPLLRKRVTENLKNVYVDTDDGVIFPSSKIDSKIMFNSKEIDFTTRQSALDPLVQYLIFASKEEVICTRRYQKLPEILGSLVGMMQLIMLFLSFAPYCTMYITTLEDFLNSLYIFPEIQRKTDNKKIQNKHQIFALTANELKWSNTPKTVDLVNHFPRVNSTRFNRLKSLLKYSHLVFKSVFNLQNKANKLTLSLIEYIAYIINMIFSKNKSGKQKLIEQAEKTFSYDLDIVNLIKKVHDLEKLKLILLNEEQLILFNYLISKPMIPFGQIENVGNFLKNDQKTIKEIYKKMKTNQNGNVIDVKFCKLLEQKSSSFTKEAYN